MITKVKSLLVSLPFIIFILMIFNACSMIEQHSGDGARVSYRLDPKAVEKIREAALEESYRRGSRAAEDVPDSLEIEVSVHGDYSKTVTSTITTETEVAFDSIPVGSDIYVEASVYTMTDGEKEYFYKGKSKNFTVRSGENQVVFVLKRVNRDGSSQGEGDNGGGSGTGGGGNNSGSSEPEITNTFPDGINFIYVANGESNGDSSNDGTEEHPLDSIEHAVEKIHEIVHPLDGSASTHSATETWGIILLSDLNGAQKVPATVSGASVQNDYLHLYIASQSKDDIKTIDGGFSAIEPTSNDSGTTLTIEPYNYTVLQCVKITGGWATYGGGIKFTGRGLDINPGAQIYGNKAKVDGAGIFAYPTTSNRVTITLDGGIIGGDNGEGNSYSGDGSYSGGKGGGVAIYGGGGNEATPGSGYVEFTMKRGSIKGNKGVQGAGVYIEGKGGVTIEGGSVTNNTTGTFSSGCGGGIYANTVTNGSVSIKGGSVTSNTAVAAGGVYAYRTKFSMTSGTVSGNTATSGLGTGLYFYKNNASVGLELSQNASFGANDYIYMDDTTPATITVNEYLATAAPVATLHLRSFTPGNTLISVTGKNGVSLSTLTEICAKFTILPDSNGNEWYIKPGTNNDGKLSRVNPITYYVSQSGLDSNGGTNSSTDSLKTIKKAIEKISTHQDSTPEIEYVIKVVGMLTDEQSFNDAAAATFPSNIDKITIEGYNGLSAGVPQDGISVSSTTRPGLIIGFDNHLGQVVFKNFKITGSSGRGLDIGGYQTNPSCHVVLDEGTLITGNGNSNPGAGVNLASGCTLTMKDGAKITGNRTSGNGGGVMLNANTTLNMYGGEISGNVAGDNGGSGVGAGVYVGGSNADGDSSVVFRGNAFINSNNDVYLRDISHSYIYIETSLNEDLVAKITPNTYHAGDQLIYTRSGGTGMPTPRMDYVYDKFAITDKADGSTWALNEDGELYKVSGGTTGGNNWSNGVLPQEFSVSATKKVKFSQGNLQYKGGTSPEWRFAEHQYDVVNETDLNIANINADYDTWIDLFGWGSSGYGAIKPYSVNYSETVSVSGTEKTLYQICYFGSMIGDNANYDWGVYNAISNGGNQAGDWRTLTYSEWNYLFNSRTNYASLRVPARIKETSASTTSIPGIVLLPDGWTSENVPNGVTFTTTVTGSGETRWETNVLTYEEWEQLESAGAVFLPAVGYQTSTGSFEYRDHPSYGTKMYYWTASSYNDETGRDDRWSYTVESGGTSFYGNNISVSSRMPVRLVKDVE